MSLFWKVLFPYALAYLICMIYRTINGILGPVLAIDLHISANSLGLLTSSYLLAFGLMQIPLGFLLDRFGPRRMQTLLFFLASLGIFLFSFGESIWQFTLARALIGLGMAGGLMAGFKATASWYESDKLPLVNGLILTAGGLGGLLATMPAELVIRYFGWRELCFLLTIITLISALFIYLFARDKSISQNPKESFSLQLQGYAQILQNRFFLRFIPMLIAMSSFISLQGLWAGSWLHQAIRLDTAHVSYLLFAVAIGMLLGFLTSGIIATHMRKFQIPIERLIILTGAFYILVQIIIFTKIWPANYILWFLFGYFPQFGSLAYAEIAKYVPKHLIGRASTALNLSMFMGAFVFQYMLGAIITLWPRDSAGYYPVSAFQVSFMILIAIEIICMLWYSFFKLPNKFHNQS